MLFVFFKLSKLITEIRFLEKLNVIKSGIV